MMASLAIDKSNQGLSPDQAVAKHLLKAAAGVAVDDSSQDDPDANTSNPDGSTQNTPPPVTAPAPAPQAPVVVNVNSTPQPGAVDQIRHATGADNIAAQFDSQGNQLSPGVVAAPLPKIQTTAPLPFDSQGNQYDPAEVGNAPDLPAVPLVSQQDLKAKQDAEALAAQQQRLKDAQKGGPQGVSAPQVAPGVKQGVRAPIQPDQLTQLSEQGPAKAQAEATAQQSVLDQNIKDNSAVTNLTNQRTTQNLDQIQQNYLDARREQLLANGAIDPHHYFTNFASKSTGEKILAGLSLFAHAFTQGGGGIMGLLTAKPLFDAIDQDAEAQKAAFLQHGKASQGFMDMIKVLQQNGVPIKNAADLARDGVKANTEAAAKAYSNKYNPPIVNQAIHDAFANRDTEGKIKLSLAQAMNEKASAAEHYANARKTGFEADQLGNPTNANGLIGKTVDAATEARLAKQGQFLVKDALGRVLGATGDKDAHDKIETQIQSLDAADQAINEFKNERNDTGELPGDSGGQTLSNARKGRLDAKQKIAIERILATDPSTRENPAQREVIQNQLGGDPAGYNFNGRIPATIQATQDGLKSKRNALVKGLTGNNPLPDPDQVPGAKERKVK